MKPGAFTDCLKQVFNPDRPLVARYRSMVWKAMVFAGLCAFGTVKLSAAGTAYDLASLLSALSGGGNVTFISNCTVTLNQTITIAQNTVLDGNGHVVTIGGSNSVGVFYVNTNVQFTLENITVANGSVIGTNITNAASGAGLYNNGGAVVLNNCVFSGNSVAGYAGTVEIGGPAAGGAVFNQAGSLNVTNCTFSSNSAVGGGFVFGNPYTGYGGSACGGAIFNNGGTVNLANSSFLANSSTGGRETNDLGGGTTIEGASFGGAFATTNGTVGIYNCSFSNNSAFEPLVYAIDSSTGGQAAGGAIFQGSGLLTMVGTTVANNTATGGSLGWYTGTPGNSEGGGLFTQGTFNSTNCVFTGNSAVGGTFGAQAADGMGGAIYNASVASIVGANIQNNNAMGGLASTGDLELSNTFCGTGRGGGVFSSNALVLVASSVSGNSAVGGFADAFSEWEPGIYGAGLGGGIYNGGPLFGTNDTFYSNSATGGSAVRIVAQYSNTGGNGEGGALLNNGGTSMLAFQTIFDNSANGGTANTNGIGIGGGIYATNGTVTLQDSIVAGSTSGNNFYASAGAVVDAGYNINSDSSFTLTGRGSLNDTDPMLGTPGRYGGPTLTVPLLAGSPAIDAAGSVFPPTDQRGLPRPYGSDADIGAYEFWPSYTIQGQITGFPTRIYSIAAGIFADVNDTNGNYTLKGVTNGTYSVTPSAAGILFVPASQIVSVGPNAAGVNFLAYQLNALSIEAFTNSTLRMAFAGTNGQTEVLESSTNLVTWLPVSTNTTGSNGIFEVFVTNNPAQASLFMRARTP
jgi:fibronectin-binding autotransporter adhesin